MDMERLTRRMCGGWGVKEGYELGTLKGQRAVVDRLAAYENTGMEPEGINDFVKRWETAVAIAELCKKGGINHLLELSRAEKDGRLVVLPCKVGDTVYSIDAVHGEVFPRVMRAITIDREPCFYIDGTYVCLNDFGQFVFLTREEAEASLEGHG